MSRFSETLLEHARYPLNFGRDEAATVVGRADLDGRPPYVEFYVRIDNGNIEGVSFWAAGCGVTVGACSALTEIVKGLSVAEASGVSCSDLASALGGVPADKEYCIAVAVSALRDALLWNSADFKQNWPRTGFIAIPVNA
jgi:NifU-like protein involved in Fe-S cluster formation